jgi:toxin HigB-1
LRFAFKKKRLHALYYEEKGSYQYPPEVVERFFDIMAIIAAAPDEREFRRLKSLHFEKLRGKRSHQHSMRLNKQWRLVSVNPRGGGPSGPDRVELKRDKEGKLVVIIDIEDYH